MRNGLQGFQNTPPPLADVGMPRWGKPELAACTQPHPHQMLVRNWGGTRPQKSSPLRTETLRPRSRTVWSMRLTGR